MNKQEITEYLLDNDGSTRDITFTPANLENLTIFLSSFLSYYDTGELNDQDGESIQIEVDSVLALLTSRNEGCIHGQLKARDALISQVYLFVDWPEESGYAIEISFFPEDLNANFSLEQFMVQLDEWWKSLDSEEVFVRYENASWDYYDPKGLGVFYHARRR